MNASDELYMAAKVCESRMAAVDRLALPRSISAASALGPRESMDVNSSCSGISVGEEIVRFVLVGTRSGYDVTAVAPFRRGRSTDKEHAIKLRASGTIRFETDSYCERQIRAVLLHFAQAEQATYLSQERAQKQSRGDIGQVADSTLAEVLPHEEHCGCSDRMREIARRPYESYQPKHHQFRTARECLGFRARGTTGETTRKVLLHEIQLGYKVVCGSKLVELYELDELWCQR
jgi:hypothetical protein